MPLSSEKADGEKNKNSVCFSGLVYEEISGKQKFLCRLCGTDRGNPAGFFASFVAFMSFDGSCAVYKAPDSDKGHEE